MSDTPTVRHRAGVLTAIEGPAGHLTLNRPKARCTR